MSMLRAGLAATAAGSAWLAVACGPEIICTGLLAYGVHVTVVDSVTGAPVTDGLEGYLFESGYAEQMEVGPGELLGAPERAGVYALLIEADGYDDWVTTGVEVGHDGCHVVPARRTARLVPGVARRAPGESLGPRGPGNSRGARPVR